MATNNYEFEVFNFLGIEKAFISLAEGQVSLITGENATGKTSLLSACAAVLSHDTNPRRIPATRRMQYIKEDTEVAEIIMRFNGEEAVRWIPGETGMTISYKAPPPLPTPVVGIEDLTGNRMSTRARAEMWESALLPPQKNLSDLISEKLEGKLGHQRLEEVKRLIKDTDIDTVEKMFKEKVLEHKREWEKITGENYGLKRAPDWTPRGWSSDMDMMTVSGAEAQVEELSEMMAESRIIDGINQAQHNLAEESKKALPKLQEKHDTLKERSDACVQRLSPIYDEIKMRENVISNKEAQINRLEKRISEISSVQSYQCPCCDEYLLFNKSKLLKKDVETERQIISDCKQEIEDCKERIEQIQTILEKVKRAQGISP